MGSPIHSRINQNEALQHEKKEKQRDIRQKIRNLFTQKQEMYDTEEDEEEEEDLEEDIEEMDKIKSMEMTEKLLRERVERLKQERMALEESWNADKYKLTSTTMMEQEFNAMHQHKENESDSLFVKVFFEELHLAWFIRGGIND